MDAKIRLWSKEAIYLFSCHLPGIGSSTCKLLGDPIPSVLEVREMTLQDFKERLAGNLDLATRIQELCWGIDDSEVKNSLDRPASIGLEDR